MTKSKLDEIAWGIYPATEKTKLLSYLEPGKLYRLRTTGRWILLLSKDEKTRSVTVLGSDKQLKTGKNPFLQAALLPEFKSRVGYLDFHSEVLFVSEECERSKHSTL